VHLTNLLRVAGNVSMPVDEQEGGSGAGKEISACERNKAIRQRCFRGGIRFARADLAAAFKACESALQDRLFPSDKGAATWYSCLRLKWISNLSRAAIFPVEILSGIWCRVNIFPVDKLVSQMIPLARNIASHSDIVAR
jgi:hypothetical protein